MTDLITLWAVRHGIPYPAIQDLIDTLTTSALPDNLTPYGDMLEAGVQQRVRFEAARQGTLLWRNNVGEVEETHVRYGLCNDSAQLNARYKSSDLIGIKPVFITPAMVGSTIGQFVAKECKRSNWHYTGNKRELAQLAFLQLVASKGGDASFTNGTVDAAVTTAYSTPQ